MNTPAVVVDDVHIVYRVFEELNGGLRSRVRRIGRERARREVHAVRGVSFTLSEGEAVAIIGPNGSGKSSLLNALTGLLPLEAGSIHVRSRPTLLGVGAALQPSLSGRRNIEIGGLALGMTGAEVEGMIDEIVGFAELEHAIDLPLQSYSSGMRARLAFSIATATIPEILLVDEALAVGDGSFRVRSAERIDEIRRSAGTVVLVSHNMQEVLGSCERAIWLDGGEVRADGPVAEVVDDYQRAAVRSVDRARRAALKTADPDGELVISRVVVGDPPPGPRRFVLHIGPSWTGTQGVQQALHRATPSLASAGTWVPRVAGDPNHLGLPAYAAPDGASIVGVAPEEWDDWRATFRTDFLASAPVRGHAAASSQHAASYLDEQGISLLAELVREAGYERFEVMAVMRRQDERVSNRMVELLREGSFLEQDPFELADPFAYDNRALVERWRSHPLVDDVQLTRFIADGAPTPAAAFFDLIGAELPDLEHEEQLDVLPQLSFDVYNHVQRIGMALRERDAIDAQGARSAITVLSRRFAGGVALTPPVAEELMMGFRDGNIEIASELDADAVAYFSAPSQATPPGSIDEFDLMAELWRYSVATRS